MPVSDDDEPRWLVALISDTGMRLSEAAGLAREDIALDADIPHVIIRPHPWRRLKTKGSERTLTLLVALYGQLGGLQRHHGTPLTCSLATAMTKAARPTQLVLH